MSAIFHVFFAAFLVLSLPGLSAASQQVVDKIVAQVNGEVITLFEVNEKAAAYAAQPGGKDKITPGDPAFKQLQEAVLKTMIDDILVKQEAKRLKVQVSETEVESRIRELREKSGMSEERFVQQLKLEGMTRKQFADVIRKDILKRQIVGYMVHRKVLVSDDEVRAYYDQNKTSLRSEKGNRIFLILLGKMDEAKALRQRIISGQITFADAARKHSSGPGAESGGDLGKVDPADLAPEIRQAVQGLQPGGVSEPVLLNGKPALVSVGSDTGPTAVSDAAGPAPFESVRESIKERLYKEKLEKQFNEYMDKLKSKSVIKINL